MLSPEEFRAFTREFCYHHWHESYERISSRVGPTHSTVESFINGKSDTGIYNAYQILTSMGTSLDEFARELNRWMLDHSGERTGIVAETSGRRIYEREIHPEDLGEAARIDVDNRARNDALDTIIRAGTRESLSGIIDQKQWDVDYEMLVLRYLRIYMKG